MISKACMYGRTDKQGKYGWVFIIYLSFVHLGFIFIFFHLPAFRVSRFAFGLSESCLIAFSFIVFFLPCASFILSLFLRSSAASGALSSLSLNSPSIHPFLLLPQPLPSIPYCPHFIPFFLTSLIVSSSSHIPPTY